MIHPTRTNLLLFKEKSRSVHNSIGILKARRQALIRELMATSTPFLASRDALKTTYSHAIHELALAAGIEGMPFLASLEAVAQRDLGLDISEKSVMGLRYKDVRLRESPRRRIDERGYDYMISTPRLEEALQHFEQVLESMLELAVFESKLKRLTQEVIRITRRIRVLEERVMPTLSLQVRTITQFLGERERESAFRLKRFRENTLEKNRG
ncbi:MAG: V-type ATP synthase subunit D [Desulfobacteraceae bacterium]|nr:V-type ATP synthase subunit D [Desulfobacteraceae bacterium]